LLPQNKNMKKNFI